MYAIVETQGHQYKVTPGQYIDVDRMGIEPGTTVDLDRVLLTVDGNDVAVGAPVVPGAKVTATVIREVKGEKIIVFRYKAKTRYRRKTGHRAQYTRLRINDIAVGA